MGLRIGHGTVRCCLLVGAVILMLIPAVKTQCTQALLSNVNDPFSTTPTFSIAAGQSILGFCDVDEAPSVQELVCNALSGNTFVSITQCADRCPELGDVPNGFYPNYPRSATDPASLQTVRTVMVTCDAGWQDQITGVGNVQLECRAGGWIRTANVAGGIITATDLCTSNMNECTVASQCPINSKCVDTVGSFNCVCDEGFEPLNDNIQLANFQCTAAGFGASDCGMVPDYAQASLPEVNFADARASSGTIILGTCDAGFQAFGGATTFQVQCVGINWSPVTSPCTNDINECIALTSPCPTNSKCINTIGSYDCECNFGFEPVANVALGSFSCIAVGCLQQPPLVTTGTYNAFTNVIGAVVTLTCNAGWQDNTGIGTATTVIIQCTANGWVLSGTSTFAIAGNLCSVDINECATLVPCQANAVCTNTLGSFSCQCGFGFEPVANALLGTTSCVQVECPEIPFIPNGRYNSFNGRINEIVPVTCSPGWLHSSGIGSVNIQCTAVSGWVISGTGTAVTSTNICSVDKNECTSVAVNGGPNPCGANAVCTNTIGSYICGCQDGFTATANRQLGEVNAVAPIDGDIGCTPSGLSGLGALDCGFTPDYSQASLPEANLVDAIDATGTSITGTCKAGYQVSPGLTTFLVTCQGVNWVPAISPCVDKNECSVAVNGGINPCGANAICTNTVGWYTCHCESGHQPQPGRTLGDVNAVGAIDGDIGCTLVTGITGLDCGFPPNYDCASHPEINLSAGFVGSGTTIQGTCKRGYQASSGITTFNIACQGTGNWLPVASPCVDINECSVAVIGGTNPCGPNAICTNTVGWYACECRDGFEATPGRTLGPVNNDGIPDGDIGCIPVSLSLVDCGFPPQYANAYHPEINFDIALASTLNSVTGKCLPGYRVDPYDTDEFWINCTTVTTGFDWYPATSPCTNIDECADNPCGSYATCIDNIGSYSCVCIFGFLQNPGSSINSNCYPVTCGEPGVDPFATYEATDSIVNVGTEVNYRCWTGFGYYDTSRRLGYEYTKECQADNTWSDGETCEDIDECSQSGICGDYSKHRCKNTQGSFQCWCYFGFYLNVDGRCAPVPEDDMDYYRCSEGCFGSRRDDDDDDNDDTALIIAIIALALTVLFFIINCIFCCLCQGQGSRTTVARQECAPACATANCKQLPVWGGNMLRYNKAC